MDASDESAGTAEAGRPRVMLPARRERLAKILANAVGLIEQHHKARQPGRRKILARQVKTAMEAVAEYYARMLEDEEAAAVARAKQKKASP